MTFRTVAGWAALGAALALTARAGAQPNVEEQARRQFESGLEFYRAGKYAEALKDFQTVTEGYPTSSVADDALMEIAEYQLDVLHDAAAARATADMLVKRYATGDSAPMGYVLAGRAILAIDHTQAGLDSALASFDRVPRLFPRSEAVAPALYYGADVDRLSSRPFDALDRLRRVALQYPRSVWTARASLLESRLLVADGQPVEAMRALQRVVRRFGSGAEATTARQWNTILYRLYVRPPGPPYLASGRSLAGSSGRLRDIQAIALSSDGKLGVAGRGGVLLLDDKGTILRQAPTAEPRQLSFDERGRFVITQKAVITREQEKGLQRLVLTTGAGPAGRLLQEISAGAVLSNGELLVADRALRTISRFDATGKFLGVFGNGRVERLAAGPNDDVAYIDADTRAITWTDRAGRMLAKMPAKGTGYVLDAPADLAFDVFRHLYVLDRDHVVVFAPGGKLVATFTPDPQSAFRSGSALALDAAARLYVYDEAQGRVVIYQ
jgi:TolA-binding protein